LDITASHEHRGTVIGMVEKVAKKVSIPFTVGGGVSTVEEMRRLLLAGADKVSINTAAVEHPDLIREGAERFGSQCIVLAVDVKKRDSAGGRSWEVYIHGGRTPTGIDVLDWVKKGESLGAGEILLTSMDTDGTKDGYDYDLLRTVSESVRIPVIASGGAGKLEHLRDAVLKGKAAAVLAASIFHYKTYSIKEVKEFLAQAGIAVRLEPGKITG
jgi:cyclase